ncbi:Cysteine--tRNA ligase [subsurface metagenome]
MRHVMALNDANTASEEALDAKPCRQQFIEAMDDDFNTPKALASLFDLARDINQASETGLSFVEDQRVLTELARNIIGLKQKDVVINVPTAEVEGRGYAPDVIIGKRQVPKAEARARRLVEERANCRKAKDYRRSDEIRKRLASLGIILDDTKEGTNIVFKREPSEESLGSLMKEFGIDFQDTHTNDG